MDTQRQTTPHSISIWHIGPHRPRTPTPSSNSLQLTQDLHSRRYNIHRHQSRRNLGRRGRSGRTGPRSAHGKGRSGWSARIPWRGRIRRSHRILRRLVLTGGTDGKIHVSDLTTLRLRSSLLGHSDAITSLNVHGDGLLTSSSADKTSRTWDIRRGQELRVHKDMPDLLGASIGSRGKEEVVVSAGDEGVCLVFATQ
ncbi:WD40 repeat-like protein [Rhizoctonia solani]|uniref:WD40 repeat-like protein n=1 Tax=Rhizoctonia solani TaxID=456999 RepID=A0A8H7I1M3_9AGAM|nr:WD40 repeat-like protein [Rhizoctonia solani]